MCGHGTIEKICKFYQGQKQDGEEGESVQKEDFNSSF